jgi:G3E family GTPase
MEKAQEHPLWAKELYGFEDHLPETEEYGITSLVYRQRDAFDPKKLHDFFHKSWPGVIRAKGFFWLITRPDFVGEMAQAGHFVDHHGVGPWWVAMDREQWPQTNEFQLSMKKYWDDRYGDRRQEIVFIGLKETFDKDWIIQHLDACIVENSLNHLHESSSYDDPFPLWFEEYDEDESDAVHQDHEDRNLSSQFSEHSLL